MIKSVAVLMTVHNRKQVTHNCLKHLFHSAELNKDRLKIKVYLVDDASTDGTRDMIQKEFPSVHLIEGDGNLFWNRGMRLAWQHAEKGDYDFYLWLNDDTIIYDDSLSQMLEAYNDNDGAVIVGATHATNDNYKTTYGGTDVEGQMANPNGRYQRLSMINGNFVLVSRSVFKVCGLLPKQLHHSGGDNYYAIVTKKNGIPCLLMKEYAGICDQHEKPVPFTDPNIPLRKRFHALYHPDNLVNQAFFLHRIENDWLGFLLHISRLHLYALFPSLVKKYIQVIRG